MAKKFTVADIIAVEQDKETTTAPTKTSGAIRFSVDDNIAAEHKDNEAKERLATSFAIGDMNMGFGRNKLKAIERAIPDEAEHRAKVDSAYDYLSTDGEYDVAEVRPANKPDAPAEIRYLNPTRGGGLVEWVTSRYDAVTGRPTTPLKDKYLPMGDATGGMSFKHVEGDNKAHIDYDNNFVANSYKMAEAIVDKLPLADADSDDEDLKAQGRVMLGDQVFNRAEAIQAAHRLVDEIMHPTLLRSNKAYRDNYFISTTGKNFEDFKLDKVSEWSSKLAELEKALSADVKSMSSAPSLATGVSPQLAMAVKADIEGLGAIRNAREQIASLKDNDFLAGLDEGFDLVSMLTAGITTMGGNIKLNNVLGKVAEGKALTPSEKALYDVYGVQQEVEQMFGLQGRSGWNNIGLGVGGSAEVVLPMAAGMGAVRAIPGLATKAIGTRTAYAAARQAFKKNTWRGLGEAIKQTAKVGGRTIANTGRATAGGLITAPFTPKMWSDFVEKRNEQYRLVDGELEYTPTKAYKDLYGAIVDQTTEIASEIAGVGLSSFLRGGAKAFGRMLHLDDIADAMGIGLNTRSVFGWRKPNWWRVAEQNIGFSGALSEPLSEVWGDVMRNTMKAPFGMSNFAEMATADYWKTTFAVSAIYGGSMQLATVPSRLAHIQQTMKLGNKAKRALSRIENTALRNNLLSIINNNDYDSAAQQMAQIPWDEYSRPDVGYAMDYIAAELPRQVGLGYIEEDMRLNAFRTEANRLANLRYKGVNGNDQTNLIVSVVTPDGVAYTVESGDYNNLDDGLLIVRDANGVKMPMAKNKIATVQNIYDYTASLQNSYTLLYSPEVEEQRVQSVKDALAEMKEPTVEQVDLLMANNGFKEHSVGDIVALADGRTAEVLGRLPNGNYDLAITENGEATEYANAPFYDVLSDAPMTRDAQIASYMRENGERAEKPAEVAPAEAPAEEVAEEMPTEGGFSVGEVVNTPNGKARITAFGDSGEVMVDMNLENTSNNPTAMALVGLTLNDISREVAPAETTTDATTEQVSVGEQTAEETPAEVESADTTPEIKSVPRLENGEVDYNAITDPDLYAEYFARDMGGKKVASAQMAKMIAATQSEVEKLAKKGDSLVDANAVVANNKEIARLNERINLYNAVHMALTPAPQVETTATAEAPAEAQTTAPIEEVAEVEETPIEAQTEVASGVVPNELSEGIATEHLAVVDAMAKMLGVRITFVQEVRDSNGNLQNAKIVGKDIYIAAGATQIETISFLTGHEFTHRMKELSPEQYAKLEDSVRNYLGDKAWSAEMEVHTRAYRRVQPNITDAEIAEEVVADFMGRQVRANNLFAQYLDSIKDKGLVDAIKSVLRAIRDFFRNINATAKDKALDEVISNLNTLIESASAKAEGAENTEAKFSLREVNNRFNEELATLTEDNARERILNVGTPSSILLACGIEDKPIRLYGAKLLSKVRKHGYNIEDLKDLPLAISSPIAVFEGSKKNSFAILTELRIGDNNVLAALSVGKGGHDVDFNIISSVYDKREDSVARWVNDGKMLWVDKKKALDYFSVSAPLAEAQNNQELISTTKVIQNFENPKIEPKFSLRELDAPYLDAVERGDMETAQRMVLEAAKRAIPNTKVVDENGNPKVVYHGTPNNFNAFSKEMFGTSTDRGIWGNGFYFSDSEQYAKTYEKRGDKQGRTLTVFLNIENPLFISLRNGGNEGAMYFHELMEKHFTDDIYEDATRTVELMSVAQERLTADIVANGYDGIVVEYTNHIDTEYVAFNPNQIKSADPVTYDDNGNVIPLSERFNPNKEDIRYSVRQPIFYSNAEYAVRGIKQEKATPEQWLKMIEKNGGLKAGEDKWLGLSDWLKASDKKTLTKDEVLQYIAENDIQIEEVEYAQFGPGLIDEATRKLEAEMREIGIDAMREKYNGFDDLFEVYNNELVWSENMASESEYEDFIIDNNIVDVNAQANAINETRINYTTNGLTNKREIALVVPTIEPYNTHDEVHFGDAGGGRAVAWIRFGETTDADGKRVLVIDEIQSKRHQEGREKGYISAEEKAKIDAIRKQRDELSMMRRDWDYRTGQAWRQFQSGEITEQEYNRLWDTQFDAEKKRLDEIEKSINTEVNVYDTFTKIPSAPFEKNWAELAMKRMLRYAAENGFDKVAWTTGDQQADRYNLSEKVDSIIYKANDNGTYQVSAMVAGRGHKLGDEIPQQELSNYVGKELADRIINSEGYKTSVSVPWPDSPYEFEKTKVEEWNALSGGDLKVGGEGMKAFYDQMLPSFVRKYAKKWGAKVGEVTMPDLEENNTMHSVDVTPAMRESVMQGQSKFSLRTMEELKGALDLYNKTSNIDNFVDTVKDISEGVGGNSYLQTLVGSYEEDNDENWFAERINNIVGDFSGGYAPYTAGGEHYSARDAETEKIFATAKEKFGTTYDMREAGYILPDGSMLDFSGRHQVRGRDTSFLNGDRTVDHREIADIAYDFDENETGVKTDLGDFLDRGAIRIDYNAGSINLNVAPTKAQKDRLKRLIERNEGYVYVDFGKGWDTEHYAEYEAARATRVLGDIDRYFDEGIKPTGNVKFSMRDESFNRATLYIKNIAREYNIKQPIFIAQSADEYVAMMRDAGVKDPESKREVAGTYIGGLDAICINGERFANATELFGTLIHERTHAITHELRDKLKALLNTLNEDDILKVRGALPSDHYKNHSPYRVLNELISIFVGSIGHTKLKAIFSGGYSIDNIMADAEAMFIEEGDVVGDVYRALVPIIKENLEIQKQLYNEDKENPTVLGRSIFEARINTAPIQSDTRLYRGGRTRLVDSQPRVPGIDRTREGSTEDRGGEVARYSLREQVANILDNYDTEGDEYGSMRDVADGVEAIIAEAEEDTTSLENIVNAYRYAQDEARRWGDRMDAGGDDDFELALRSYAHADNVRYSVDTQDKPFGSVRAREEAIAMAERGDYASDIYRKTGWYYDAKSNNWRGTTRLHNDLYIEMRSKEEAAMPFFEDDGNETHILGDISEEIVESAVYRSSEEKILAHMKNRHLVARERIRKAAKVDIDNTRRTYNEANRRRTEGLERRTTNAAQVAYILADIAPESLSFYDQALVKIARDEVHISWDDVGNKRGLASELGLKKGEKRSYSNITKGATMGHEEFVHGWWQEIGGYEKDIDTQDLRNALIEALGDANRPTQALATLRKKFDTALAERDEVIARLKFDMEQALLAEDERYNNEVEGFKTSEDKQQRIADYEREVIFFDEAEAMGGTLRTVEKKLADVIAKSKAKENELKAKHALKRAELRSDAEVARRGLAKYRRSYEEYKELADAIDDAKNQIRDVVNNTEVLQFRRREINRLINTLDNARSINDLEYISRRLESLLLDISIRQNRENLNRLLNLRLPNGQYAEAWINNQIASGAITTAEGKRILTDMWRGTNNKGIRVARYVDGETGAILRYLRNELIVPNSRRFYVKEKDAEGNVILDENGKEKKTLTADKELELNVEAEIQKAQQRIDDITNFLEGNKTKTEVPEKSVPREIEREALYRYITYLRIVDAKQEIEEAHETLEETDVVLKEGDLFKQVRKDIYDALERSEAILNNENSSPEQREQAREQLAKANKALEDAKKEAREIRKQAFEQLNTAKERYNSLMAEFNTNLSELLANGRDAYKAFRDAQEEHRKEIINEALNAIGGRSYAKHPAPTAMQNIRARAIVGGINNAFYTFQMVLKEIDRYAPNGEGEFYNRYMNGAQSAQDNFITMQNMHFVQIADKINELWKEEFKNSNPYVAFKALSDAMSTYRVGTIVYKPFIDKDGEAYGYEEWPLVVPNAMYLLAMWQQPRYAMAMAKRGITEEFMLELKDTIRSIDHRLIKFMDWVRDELLPNTRLEYNAVYREIFGIDMDMEANYFPAKVTGFYKEEKVEQHEPEVRSSQATGIIARTSRGLMPDPSVNYFSILAEHLQKMDQWASFQKLNNDINALTSNKEFKGRMATLMPGYKDAVDGYGGLVWLWKRTAAIMLKQYKPQESGIDAVFRALQRGWAASNISWRFMTALKQFASMPVFAVYSLDPECAKLFMQELGFVTSMIVRGKGKELFQAIADEYPTFRKRWTERNAGMEWLTRNISPSGNMVDLRRSSKYNIIAKAEALESACQKLAIEWGMAPNAFVDALSVIVGLRTVQAFEEYRISKDKGRLTDEDIELAKVKAAIAINETQQSAEGAYLSVIQMQRSAISALFVTYLNNTFANHRKRLAGATELYRQFFDKDWLKEMENRYGDKLPEVRRQAQMKALADIGQGVIADFNFQLLGAAGAILPMLFNGDDEEEAWYEVGLDAFVAFLSNIAVGGLVGGNVATGLIQDYTPSILPSLDEIQRDWKKIKSNWKDNRYGEFAYLTLNVIAKNGVGVDFDTYLNMLKGVKAIFDGEGTVGVMKLLNAPQSQIDLIAGAKREGETVMEYVTRRMRLEAIFATSYYDAFNEDGKLINRPFGISTYKLRQLHKDCETAYRRQVVIREEGRRGWNDMLDVDEEYKDVVKAIGWTAEKNPNNKAFESGEYEAPVEGMTEEQYEEAEELEEMIAERAREVKKFVGTDQEYYSLVKEMTEYKKQLIDNYNGLE